MRSVLVILLFSLWAPALLAAEWTYESMQGVTTTCIESDPIHGRILVGTIEGFHYLDIPTGQWTSRDWVGWIGRTVRSIGWHPNHDQRVITGRVNAFFKGYIEISHDLGVSEEVAYSSNGGSVTGLARDATDPDLFYACTWSDVAPGEITRSRDGGLHWTLLAGTIQYALTSIAVDVAGTVYVGGSDRVTRSLDQGDTWEPAWNGLPENYGIYCLEVNPEMPGHLLASNDLGLYASSDGADSWTMILPVSCRNIAWSPGLCGVPDQRTEGPIALATWDDRVLVSTNSGIDWDDESGDLPQGAVDLTFSTYDSQLYAATANRGTFRTRILDPSGVGEVVVSAPVSIAGPQPYRPGDHLTYTLEHTGHVLLDILDVTGRRQAVLINRWLAAGTHTTHWDTHGMPAGVYYGRLRSRADQALVRIILAY